MQSAVAQVVVLLQLYLYGWQLPESWHLITWLNSSAHSLLCARHGSRKFVGFWNDEPYTLLACLGMLYFLLFPAVVLGIFCSVWNHIHSSCFEGCLHSAVCLSCTVNVWYYFCKTVIPSKHKCVLLKTSKITTGTQVWLCFFVSHIAPSHTCFQKSIFWNNMTISLLSELSLLFSL